MYGVRGFSGVAAAVVLFGSPVWGQEPDCRSGATALADAYVLANPMYSYFLGIELESYVTQNREHFATNGDAIRCGAALARAFLSASVQLYDPGDAQRQQELNARLGAMGVSPGPQEASPASQMFGASLQLSRLVRVLPSAAAGDFEPLRTPTTEIEQMQLQAGQILRVLLQNDPDMAATIAPIMKELARLEHEALRRAAANLANGH